MSLEEEEYRPDLTGANILIQLQVLHHSQRALGQICLKACENVAVSLELVFSPGTPVTSMIYTRPWFCSKCDDKGTVESVLSSLIVLLVSSH